MTRPRLLLVDDHRLVLDGLQARLEPDFEIVGTLAKGAPVASACARKHPDVVLLDYSLPDKSGLEVLAEIRARALDVKVLLVTMHNDRALADAALRAGADGYLPKDADAAELRRAIGEVLQGRIYLSPRLKQPAPATTDERDFHLELLTPRRRQILRWLGEGKSTAEIAAELKLTPAAISFHRTRLRQLLGLESEFELTRFAVMVKERLDRAP